MPLKCNTDALMKMWSSTRFIDRGSLTSLIRKVRFSFSGQGKSNENVFSGSCIGWTSQFSANFYLILFGQKAMSLPGYLSTGIFNRTNPFKGVVRSKI